MKKIFYIGICYFFTQLAVAQKMVPEIKDHTQLDYFFDLHGQKRPITMTVQKKKDTILMQWDLRGYKGNYLILPEAVKNGDAMNFKQGALFQTLVLGSKETFCMISQTAYQDLLRDKHFIYNQTTYVLETPPEAIVIDGKPLDVLYVKAQIDATEMWILKNPDFPLICKISNNPLGINYLLTAVSQPKFKK